MGANYLYLLSDFVISYMSSSNRFISNNQVISSDLGIEKLQKSISQKYQINESDKIAYLSKLFIEQLADNLELTSIPTQTQKSLLNASLHPLIHFSPLPDDFPHNLAMPLYIYGDKVFHESIEELAIVIGRFCAFEQISGQWRWKYLILSIQDFAINPFFASQVCGEAELKSAELR